MTRTRSFRSAWLVLLVAAVAGVGAAAAPRSSDQETTWAVDAARHAIHLGTVVADRDADGRVRDIAFARDMATRLAGRVALQARERAEHAPHVFSWWWETVSHDRSVDRIAREFGYDRLDLARLNPGVDLDRVEPGERLLVWRPDTQADSTSAGRANRGRLHNGIPMPDGDGYVVRNRARAWGTRDTVRAIIDGFAHVQRTHPSTPASVLGDLSHPGGGKMRPHKSHQSGRDLDGSFFRRGTQGVSPFARVTPAELDVAPQWALFRHWIANDQVEYIFVGTRLLNALRNHAIAIGEDPELVRRAFAWPRGKGDGIIRWARGHDDHFHARFRCAEDDDRCL